MGGMGMGMAIRQLQLPLAVPERETVVEEEVLIPMSRVKFPVKDAYKLFDLGMRKLILAMEKANELQDVTILVSGYRHGRR